MASSTPRPWSAAKLRTWWLICIEQNLGPHMEQKWAVLAAGAGRAWSCSSRALSGSRDSSNLVFPAELEAGSG